MADPIRITNVREVCDFSPARRCQDTLYAPCVCDGRLYTMGGHTDSPQQKEFPPTSPLRFADEIFVSALDADGKAASPKLCIGKSSFPWMVSQKTYDADKALTDQPEAFIGSVGSPCVQKVGDVWYMLVCATVSDPNITTGDNHGGAPTVYGSRSVPWAFFALFWFASLDGENFTIVNMHRRSSNVAFEHAALIAIPGVDAGLTHPQEFVGIPACSVLLVDGFFHVLIQFTGIAGQKNGLVRVPASGAGQLRDFQLWNGADFENLDDGQLPLSFTRDHNKGQVHALLPNQIAATSHFPGSKFLCVTPAASQRPNGTFKLADHIEISPTNELTSFPQTLIIRIDAPGFGADALAGTILNPIYCEDASGWWLMWGSNAPGCDGQGGYKGARIWRGEPES